MDIDENSCFTNIVSTTEENFLTVFSTGVIKKKIDMVLVIITDLMCYAIWKYIYSVIYYHLKLMSLV